ncbi:hypothetical protein SB861_50700 [Paraburkholderia sp. SIMBA_049]
MVKRELLAFAMALTLPLAATSAPIGDWTTGSTDDGLLYAGAVNDSGGALMKACNPSSGYCYWYLVTATSCDKGLSIPALFSTSTGARSFQLTCDTPIKGPSGTMYRAVINDPDTMDALLDSTRPLGIAVALQDGRFAVYRFSMAGAKRAVSILMEGTLNLNGASAHSTRDSTL